LKFIRICVLIIVCISLSGITVAKDSTDVKKITEKKRYPLEVNFAIGGSISGGNNSARTAMLDSELQKRYTRFRIRVNGKGAYGEASYSDGPWIESTNNWLISSRVDWFTTSQLHSFLFTEGAMQSNQYRGYWLKNSVQGGYGVKLFSSSDLIDLSLPLGIDYAREMLVVDNGQKPENFSAVLKPELTVTFNSHVRYRQKSNLFMDLGNEEDYRIDSENIIDVMVTKAFSLRMAYSISHYNKPRLIREVDQSGQQTGNRIRARPTDHMFTTSVMISL